eukprot:gnl/MRDRNA2_/MRDRNA2_95943_c0_seq1.p1 gnl/MRDRNA2_/MRDRNA2_95943_c0~~gnl/MRDRNA2_/MRDRNA2_95943_c0_seq1.p1  ORF type:complete len:251 (-),score=52.62 gnl/MRDRNA2_/MRDRNA2_95943_c0_seq1:660-1412(-)
MDAWKMHDQVMREGLDMYHRTWPAAVSFAHWLEKNKNEVGLDKPNVHILELGSGNGWLGCVLARNLPNVERIELTDLPHAVSELEADCHNFAKKYSVKKPCVFPLNWDDLRCGVKRRNEWDILLGSDLVWTRNGAEFFPQTISALFESSKPGAKAYYAHWVRSPALVPILLQAFSDTGLDATWVNPPHTVDSEIEKEASVEKLCQTISMDSEDNSDWTHQIFDEEENKQLPFFIIYLIRPSINQQMITKS